MKAILQPLRFLYMLLKHRGRVSFPLSAVIGRNASFEGCNAIGAFSEFSGYMGKYSYITDHCDMFAKIGRFTSIGANVQTIMYRHPTTYPYVSTSPMFYSTSRQCGIENFADRQMFTERVLRDPDNGYAVTIGNDCWINSNVTLISGISIGDGAIILTGSVVTRDVPPYSIVGGIPAKVIKYRYSDEDINWLLASEWWNKSDEWLREHWQDFNDIDSLKKSLVQA